MSVCAKNDLKAQILIYKKERNQCHTLFKKRKADIVNLHTFKFNGSHTTFKNTTIFERKTIKQSKSYDSETFIFCVECAIYCFVDKVLLGTLCFCLVKGML